MTANRHGRWMVLWLLLASWAAAQEAPPPASRPATAPSGVSGNFPWWPAYRSMIDGLSAEQVDRIEGVTAAFGQVMATLYEGLRNQTLTPQQYRGRIAQLQADVEQARRDVLTAAQQAQLNQLEAVWRMKIEAFRGVSNPYYGVQFDEAQLVRIISYRVGTYDPAIQQVEQQNGRLVKAYAQARDAAARQEALERVGQLEQRRRQLLEQFQQFVEGLLRPEQIQAVPPEAAVGASSVRLNIDMRQWPPLKAIRQIAEIGGVELQIDPAARQILEKTDQTVQIISSPVTPEHAIERVAAAFGLRAVRRAGVLVLSAPEEGALVVGATQYGSEKIDVTVSAPKPQLVKWRFPVSDILRRHSYKKLTDVIHSVSKTAAVELDNSTNTILVIMPRDEVAAVNASIEALRH